MYTGLGDGRVVRLDPNGENPQTVLFTGAVVSAAGRAVGSTTGVDFGNLLVHTCHEKVVTVTLLDPHSRFGDKLLKIRVSLFL